ncbi:CHAT domain-containing protein [Flavobacterium sp. IB48]|uniref:CHAT domain-containing protein n=1 Tax=Flavobacterium sp. IB48 TaxID=2779375 RepID=UPI0018E819C5|nr:CHAT domain-containing tetratricopeptide repeat protein [Flavobacterium sp. IB48]MBJ2123308.1 CHAT domain-containing protein [Flavobacterium sp. IB48]
MNLHHLYGFILLLLNLNVFGQSQEDKIYNAVDSFTANPSAEALQNLRSIETDFWKSAKPKTKEELLAIVILNCNKAYYENQFGQTLDAIKSYEKAWMIYQKNKLKNYDITEFCLKPLGNLYTILGDYKNAENTIKQYYFIDNEEKNEKQKIAAILNLSNVYQNSGKVQEAIEIIEKTLRSEKITSSQKGLLLNNLGANYLLRNINEDFTEAENAFLKAIPLLKKDKALSENLYNTYINLYRIRLNFNLKDATLYFAKAQAIFEKLPQQEPRKKAQFYLEKAFLLLKQNSLEEAQNELTTVYKTLLPNYQSQKNILPNESSLYAETVLLDALDLQAELYLSQNEPKNALKSYTLSFYIEELFQSLLIYEDSKIITQIRNRNRTEKCLDIYKSLFDSEKKQSYIEDAFKLAEKTKSVVLKDHLKNVELLSREEKLILQQMQNWNTIILKEQQKQDLADISKINEAIQKQNKLMLLLKSNEEKNNKKNQTSFDLQKLYAKLDKDDAVLYEYFMGYKAIHLFVVQNNKIQLKSICIGHICSEPIIRFIRFFDNPESIVSNVGNYQKTAFFTHKKLLLPAKLDSKNLIIIPDGLLNFLPFEALITKESKTTNFTKMHYLLDKFDIAYNNSAELYLNANTLSSGKRNILGLFPVFGKTNYELPFSKNELQSIKHNFDGQFFENENATFSNFKNNVTGKSIIHLSTHASSGDFEIPASIKFYDQEILFSELYNLQLSPDLVVLSACETGIGKLYKGEGAMSIARGFQFAGAQNLLFSLWNVNDYTTSVFMDYFYKDLKHNSSFAHATANAKRKFLKDENIPNAKKSPYYWSAFVYYGTLEKPETQTNYILYIISFLGLIGLFLGFNHYRNGKSSRNSQKREL